MSSFTEDLIMQWEPKLKTFIVYVSFAYHVGSEDSEEIIVVPEGYMTDLASIPPVVRGLIPKLGKHAQAAVVHDFICQNQTYSRKKCDDIFLEAMEVLKVNKFKRYLMYKAVRLFGWLFWKKPNVG